jgi:hypothetical protein
MTNSKVRLRIGVATMAASAIVAGMCSLSSTASATTPTGPKVVLFNDPDYVDAGTAQDVADGDYDHEGINMQLALQTQGADVTVLATDDAASVSAALTGRTALVLPEIEEGSLSDLSSDTLDVVRSWVLSGGTLVIAADYSGDEVDGLLGSAVADADQEAADYGLVAPTGSPFAGGPATLPVNDGEAVVSTSSLPAGAIPLYADAQTDSTIAFSLAIGKGILVELGWDWYDAKPADPTDGQDGGWNEVLRRAVNIAPPAPVVPITTPAAKAPGAVSHLKIKGKTSAKTRKVTWAAPTTTGGAAITGYRLVVRQQGKVSLSKSLGAQARHFTIKLRKLSKKTRSAVVEISAVNSAGTGSASSATFHLPR